MMVHVPELLGQEGRACGSAARRRLGGRPGDGRPPVGPGQAEPAGARGQPCRARAGDLVLGALERSALFVSAVLPQRVFPPLFNRYAEEMSFGSHVDNAIRPIPGRPAACAPMCRPRCSCPIPTATTGASWWWRTPTAATR